MSKETAKILHLKILEDQSLQKAMLDEAYKTGSEPDWSKMATQFGLELTQDEAHEYLDDLGNEEYELSEFELELVAAATPPACVNTDA